MPTNTPTKPATSANTTPPNPTITNTQPPVHRIEVRPTQRAGDPIAERLRKDANSIGLSPTAATVARVYLIQAELNPQQLAAIQQRLLADPVLETPNLGTQPTPPNQTTIEIHPLPGVMDPAAQSVQDAIQDLLNLQTSHHIHVSTGYRYDIAGLSQHQTETIAKRFLFNPVIQRAHSQPYHPPTFPTPASKQHAVRNITIRNLTDAQLESLSRDAHLFLSLDEMRAIQAEYNRLGRDPTDIEIETLAQTWSEHCVHKTLKSTVRYTAAPQTSNNNTKDPIDWTNRPNHTINPDGSVTIHNLLKSTVAAATHELIADGIDWTLSVFVDNAGIIAFDNENAVCVKVETHNHPSAIEPYGGAATGIGGCIRDIMGTGLAAKPIASTDVFCVAHPNTTDIPSGCIHPSRVLSQVVAGVRDYGNRMGIPTVNGAVYFDNRYIGNPLVYCGCIGVMPADKTAGAAQPGDLIVAIGGKTGRDGIHGATFSSAELTDTHADEFAHAVQIGNAIEEKRTLDAILRARDHKTGCLYNAITDCGAGGFSSAIGEMGEKLGATVNLENAPLKYPGLSHDEIWISEAQERMILAVPQHNLETIRQICNEEHAELAVLGTFGTPNQDLILNFHNNEVGRLSMHFLHEGIPMPTREAHWNPIQEPTASTTASTPLPNINDALLALLAHPNIASKHWIIRQYDHEVQGNTIIRPLAGPLGRGPMDAAVIQPVPGSTKGLAIACGLAPSIGDTQNNGDPYLMALAAIDECMRNLVCVGADPTRTAILDNFCWPSCNKPHNMASLVRACEGCYDAAKAYRTPFVSGKDSLNNQFRTDDGRTIEIPPTLLITGIAIVHDINTCVTMDAKSPTSTLLLVGQTQPNIAGSHLLDRYPNLANTPIPHANTKNVPSTDLTTTPQTARAVAALISAGIVRAAHDISDGGLLTAVAEMLIAGSTPTNPIGAHIDLTNVHQSAAVAAFSESPARYIIEIDPNNLQRAREILANIPSTTIGSLNNSATLTITHTTDQSLRNNPPRPIEVEQLAKTWQNPLDW